MKSVADKILDARSAAHFTQEQLAEMVGVSRRSIAAYERGESLPRKSTVLKLGKALSVSTKYLTRDDCDDPLEDISKDSYYTEAMEKYGSNGVKDMEAFLEEGKALLAGGSISQEKKDELFEAFAQAYFLCKAEAKKKYGKNE
jgi:transcriptional regulator with XRE-family HTH domain